MYFVLNKTDLRHGLSDTVFLWAPLPQAVLALYHAIAASAFTRSCQNYWKICSTLVVNIVLKPSADKQQIYHTERSTAAISICAWWQDTSWKWCLQKYILGKARPQWKVCLFAPNCRISIDSCRFPVLLNLYHSRASSRRVETEVIWSVILLSVYRCMLLWKLYD